MSVDALDDRRRCAPEFVRTDWMEDRACVGKPVSFFFPAPKQGPAVYQAIRDLCASCPVRQQCLDYSLADSETKGWWGGLSEVQRRRLRTGRPKARRLFKERARQPIAHGTVRGRSAHIRRKEAVCDECRDAWNEHKRMLRRVAA